MGYHSIGMRLFCLRCNDLQFISMAFSVVRFSDARLVLDIYNTIIKNVFNCSWNIIFRLYWFEEHPIWNVNVFVLTVLLKHTYRTGLRNALNLGTYVIIETTPLFSLKLNRVITVPTANGDQTMKYEATKQAMLIWKCLKFSFSWLTLSIVSWLSSLCSLLLRSINPWNHWKNPKQIWLTYKSTR